MNYYHFYFFCVIFATYYFTLQTKYLYYNTYKRDGSKPTTVR